MTARSGTPHTATRATALATLLVGDEAKARRTLAPAVAHATGALELGARSVSGLVAAAHRIARPQRSLSPADWEREVVGLRYLVWDTGAGPGRHEALSAYCACVAAARRAVGAGGEPGRRQRVDAVLRLEERLLDSRHLSARERAVAMRAVTRSRADIAGQRLP